MADRAEGGREGSLTTRWGRPASPAAELLKLGGMQGVKVPKAIEIETARLRLRQWRESDRAPFAAMNADAEVMKFFASLQSREASDASIDAWQSQFAERGWSNWAAEAMSSNVFIGFIGLSVPRRVLPFSPCVEVGWRLARPYWGQGYATEGARAALRVGFEQLELAEIVSFTSVLNSRSQGVMERIGMSNAHEDFEHPGVPEGHPLRPHCLYRITRAKWSENAA
jgi:RimJ/RimL family protein N-acetyltransferase